MAATTIAPVGATGGRLRPVMCNDPDAQWPGRPLKLPP